MTDWLTLSAAYGQMHDRFDNEGVAGDVSLPAVRNYGGELNGVPYGGYFNGQSTISISSPYKTKREFYRADADLTFSILGDHHVRFGFDRENNTLTESAIRTGGAFEFANGMITSDAYNYRGSGGGYFYRVLSDSTVLLDYYNSGGAFTAKNTAFYIEDEWKLTDRLTLNVGLRRDDFKVNASDGSKFANLTGNYAPRLGFTYNILPDRSGKIYGSFSRYFLPFASNTAFRMTGSEVYFRERWNYSGFDANGLPILTTQVTDNGTYQSTCPFGITPNSSGLNCTVTGDGSVSPSNAALAHNLKATRETEIVIGYEQKLGDWTVGVAYTHRNLDNTAEDMAIDKAVNAWCEANGITGCSNTWTGYNQYVIANPGKDLTIDLLGLDGRTVTFTAEELGYPKAKRTYDAVEFTFNRPWDGHWSLGGSYTWSKSKGNSEGFVQSDFGQDDAGITQDFDQPGFTEYAYGYLPNDRRHRFKLYGAVALSPAFTLGLNARIDSPRHLSCFGYYPDPDAFENGYGAASHFCGGTPSPRGTAQKSDWVSTFDVSARYNVEIPSGQTVTFRADVFNLFNSQAIQKRNEIGDSDYYLGVFYANPAYGTATAYQAPRYIRLGMDVSF